MKTLQSIQAEISSIEAMKPTEISQWERGEQLALFRRLKLLRTLKKYLETNPAEEFIKKEYERLETYIKNKMLEFPKEKYEAMKLVKQTIYKMKQEHEIKYGIPQMKIQSQALRELLHD